MQNVMKLFNISCGKRQVMSRMSPMEERNGARRFKFNIAEVGFLFKIEKPELQ